MPIRLGRGARCACGRARYPPQPNSSHLRSGARAEVRVRLFMWRHPCVSRPAHDTVRESHVPSRSARAPRASVQDAWPHESGSRSRLGWPHRRRKTRQDRRPRGRHRLVLLLGDRRVEGRVDDDAHAARDGDRQRARPKHVRAYREGAETAPGRVAGEYAKSRAAAPTTEMGTIRTPARAAMVEGPFLKLPSTPSCREGRRGAAR